MDTNARFALLAPVTRCAYLFVYVQHADGLAVKARRTAGACFRFQVFLPCGHASFCFTCAKKVLEGPRTCPLCRTQATEVLKIADAADQAGSLPKIVLSEISAR